jgi:hypothetical protein
MLTVAGVVGAVVILYGLHRLALWMEDRGWIFYMKKQASPDAIGNALLTLHEMVKPDMKNVMQVKQKRTKHDAQGEPPETP